LRAEHPAPYRLPDGVPWHRSYAQDAIPLAAGEIARLRIGMLPTSYVVRTGHRIQVTVTGADHRGSAPLPDAQGARIEVLTAPDRPSLVQLPIAPA
jgi:predicted acyl esterase